MRQARRAPSLAAALGRAELFAGLPPRALERVAEHAESKRVPAGEYLFRAGDTGDCLYVVRAGRLKVVLDGGTRPLAPGDAVGELAAITGGVRSAAVVAVRDSELVAVSRHSIEALLAEDRTFARELLRVLAERLRSSAPRGLMTVARPATIAIIPLGEGLPVDAVASGMVAELEAHAPVARLDQPRAGGQDAVEALEVAERACDHTVLVASRPPDDEWSAFCLRQADRALFLIDPAAAPVPITRNGPPGGAGDLGACGPGPLDGWLDVVRPRAVHVLEDGDGIARAARRLAGRAVGVVLSGGAARGLAHIGVLEGLQDAGVLVDRVGGCSMGALIGGQYALGATPADITRRCREELVERKPLSDYTVPRVSLIRARRAARMLDRIFGDAQIERMPRSFSCVSADLVSAQLVVHRRGKAASAVGASMSLPGLAPPRVDGDRLLVDGGVLDNLPVEEMAGEREGPVIAVDAMGRRPLGGGGKLPSLLDTLARSTVLGSWRELESKRAAADLVIEPDTPAVGLLEFDALERMVEAGRVAGRRAGEQFRLRG